MKSVQLGVSEAPHREVFNQLSFKEEDYGRQIAAETIFRQKDVL